MLSGHAVGERLQPGHVSAGQSRAGQRLKQRTSERSARQRREARRSKAGDRARGREYRARIDAIRDARQERHGQHVSEEKCASNKSGLQSAQAPGRAQMRQEGRVGGKAGHAQRFGRTYQCAQANRPG
jgi:hypothetical protein